MLAVFPGSFDPPTFGHLNIIERCSRLFDEIDVVISVNPDKKYLFTDKERYDMLREITSVYKNVSVHICKTLISDYCAKAGAKVLLRGIRNTNDFSYEFDLSLINRSLNQNVETLFVPTEQRYFLIRSSSIKELARYGGDISAMVPPVVEKAIKEKYRENS
ncbi:MAG: pantetheine-phosphate adenylyltransferase [Treponema sp.]|nr:pantetheine-phosphate adenylyltransferase [Treponema sp.]MBQ4235882.1 pantetheine-phosphate adenylyltransferase [Treponema sp.]MBQ5384434.1 pantetheine-phosphate adenylyltransferase [Treponema sp.]